MHSSAIHIFQNEIAVVISVIRKALRYRISQMAQDPLLQEFHKLKNRTSRLTDLSQLTVEEALKPFLEVIGAKLIGTATDAALSSIKKFLELEIIGEHMSKPREGAEAIAYAVTNARFSATDKEKDAVVFKRIVDVLKTLVASKLGRFLSGETIFIVLQTCKEIAIEESLSELLRRSTAQALEDIVSHLFSRVPELEAQRRTVEELAFTDTLEPHQIPDFHQKSPLRILQSVPGTPLRELQSTEEGPEAAISARELDMGDESIDVDESALEASQTSIEDSTSAPPSATQEKPSPKSDSRTNSRGVRFQNADCEEPIVDLTPYGINCVADVLHFLMSLVDPDDKFFTVQQQILGLTLLTKAIETCSPSIKSSSPLLEAVEDHVCRTLFKLINQSSDISSTSLRILFLIFQSSRSRLKFQLEKLLKLLLEVNGTDYQRLDNVLECLLRLFQLPGFANELFINFDCQLYCDDLLSNIVDFLAQQAFPDNINLCTTHFSALEALLAIVNQIEAKQKAIPVTAHNLATEISSIKQKKLLLLEGVEMFNKKAAKGLDYWKEHGLLSSPLNANETAALLKTHPKLDKAVLGDFFGRNKDFNVEVLSSFINLFDFSDKEIDVALREFLTSFRLPGESQIIDRIVEKFSYRWYTSFQGHRVPASPDAAYILAYSIIMLNVDQHNPQNKRRMKAQHFIRNLRGQNKETEKSPDADFPPEYLTSIFNRISKNEIVLPDEQAGQVKDTYEWEVILARSRQLESQLQPSANHLDYDREIFRLVWGRCVTALASVFDVSRDGDILDVVIEGFKPCAQVAASFEMPDVFDNIIVTLCSRVLCNLSPQDIASTSIDSLLTWHYGVNQPARKAAVAMFDLARSHGSVLREGWKDVLQVIQQFLLAKVLPDPLMILHDFTNPEGTSLFRLEQSAPGKNDGFFGWFFSSEPQPTPQEDQPMRPSAKELVLSCFVPTLFADSRTLPPQALHALCQTLIKFASIPEPDELDRGVLKPQQLETCAVFFLEALANVVVWNKDRAALLWAPLSKHLQLILSKMAPTAPFLTERAVVSAFRVGNRLISTHDDLLGQVVPVLQTVMLLEDNSNDKRVVHQIVAAVHDLATKLGPNLKNESVLEVIFTGLKRAKVDAYAMHRALDSISHLIDVIPLSPMKRLKTLIDIVLDFAARLVTNPQQYFTQEENENPKSSLAMKILDLMEKLNLRIHSAYSQENGNIEDTGDVAIVWRHYWEPLLKGMSAFFVDHRQLVRQAALATLQRSLLNPDLSVATANEWMLCFENVMFPLLSRLLDVRDASVANVSLDEIRMRSCALLSKLFLHHINALRSLESFGTLWDKVLDFMHRYLVVGESDLLPEAIPEHLKNMLLCMSTIGVFHSSEDVQGASGQVLWDITWTKVEAFQPGLLGELFPEQAQTQHASIQTNLAQAAETLDETQVTVAEYVSTETSVQIERTTEESIIVTEIEELEDRVVSSPVELPDILPRTNQPRDDDHDEDGATGGGDGSLHPHPIIV